MEATQIINAPGHLGQGRQVETSGSMLLALARELIFAARAWPGIHHSTQRVWGLMASSQDVEAWVIGWPPGGSIELHDHGESSGALVIVEGELIEMVVAEDERGDLAIASTPMPSSASVTFDVGRVHGIVNKGLDPAISVHVYAPPLSGMTYYEFADGILEARASVNYQPGAAPP
jgi:predicted metal-dependent enzyme (double-stranded beta helix superfamily)